jgi:hypothetical protein
MHTIYVNHKNAVTKGVTVKGYINPNSNHNTLMLNGISMHDLVLLRDYQIVNGIANNACCIDLRVNDFSIL